MFCSSFPLTNSLYLAAVGVNTTLLSLSVSYTPSTNPFCKKKKYAIVSRKWTISCSRLFAFLIRSTNKYINKFQIGAINTNVQLLTLLFAKKKKRKKNLHSCSKYFERAYNDRLYRIHSSHGQFSKTRRKFRVSSSREPNALHWRQKTTASKILRNYLHGRYVGKETQEWISARWYLSPDKRQCHNSFPRALGVIYIYTTQVEWRTATLH